MYTLSLKFGNKKSILAIAIQLNRLSVSLKVSVLVSVYAVFFSFFALSAEVYVLSVYVNPLIVTLINLK